MRKRSTHIAIIAFAITVFGPALMPSTAKAWTAACAAAMPRIKVIGAEQFRLIASLKRSGDCSYYLPKVMALRSKFKAVSLGAGCTYWGTSNAHWAASMQKYCRTNVAKKSPSPNPAPSSANPPNPSDQKSVRRGSARDAGACSDDMSNCGGVSGPSYPPGPPVRPWGVGCTTLAPCSQPPPISPSIDLAEAKRLDEIQLQQYSNVYHNEQRFWQTVEAILAALGAEPPNAATYIEQSAESYQAQEIKRTMPDYLTDEEIADQAIDELAANKMASEIKNDPSTEQPAPNAQALWNKFEKALTDQDAPAQSLGPEGQAASPPPN